MQVVFCMFKAVNLTLVVMFYTCCCCLSCCFQPWTWQIAVGLFSASFETVMIVGGVIILLLLALLKWGGGGIWPPPQHRLAKGGAVWPITLCSRVKRRVELQVLPSITAW